MNGPEYSQSRLDSATPAIYYAISARANVALVVTSCPRIFVPGWTGAERVGLVGKEVTT